MLTVRHLTKRYGAHVALDDVSFEVGEGEVVGFLGPNGAGKSTTLRMITGYLAPTAGAIQVAGVDALKHPQRARQAFGYMPEGVPLHPELRVHEYLRYRAELKGVPRRKIGEAIDRSLTQASVADAEDRIIRQLSKGYRQRVGLADALLSDPPLLILDEPTSGLDPNQIRFVRELIRGFSGNKTVFLSTHILPEVEATCDRVVIINKGKKVGEGEPRTLRARNRQDFFVRFAGAGELDRFRAAVAPLAGFGDLSLEQEGELVRGRIRAPEEAAVEVLFRAVADAGLALRELATEAEGLENIFAKLTTEEPEVDADADSSIDSASESESDEQEDAS